MTFAAAFTAAASVLGLLGLVVLVLAAVVTLAADLGHPDVAAPRREVTHR